MILPSRTTAPIFWCHLTSYGTSSFILPPPVHGRHNQIDYYTDTKHMDRHHSILNTSNIRKNTQSYWYYHNRRTGLLCYSFTHLLWGVQWIRCLTVRAEECCHIETPNGFTKIIDHWFATTVAIDSDFDGVQPITSKKVLRTDLALRLLPSSKSLRDCSIFLSKRVVKMSSTSLSLLVPAPRLELGTPWCLLRRLFLHNYSQVLYQLS